MVIQQEIDKKRYGNGMTSCSRAGSRLFTKSPKAFYETDSDSDNEGQYSGGFIDIASLVSNVGKFVSDNKDTIQSIASTAGKVVDMGKSISDTVKASNELAKMQVKPNKKRLTPEQEAVMFGSGFATFKLK